eukprot:TRINITY_DN24127_c0_g1_i1.p1 TRINITY_DN24127_c0_g1~~TRINITY_DN24127_c0_g1_i1.p1  ORF type:complete len:230 (-),score=27.68 TRINITY_DN24127_c0_g1_i1:143-832(-)
MLLIIPPRHVVLSSLIFIALPINASSVDVYFGCGCFWHVQHAFVNLEERLLGRTGSAVTARAAYAGSRAVSSNGLVCYHNSAGISDYANMGYAEAVSVSVPEEHFDAFVNQFWEICPHGNRKDAMDLDHQYRSVIGVPGGMTSPLFARLGKGKIAAKLVEGHGGDGDTYGNDEVWVYDSKRFPAHVAEKYHQFHDDFMTSSYGGSYHAMQDLASKTGCPGDADYTPLWS